MRFSFDSGRLSYRNLTVEDAEAAYKWCSDPEVNRFMIYPVYTDIEQLREWLRGKEAEIGDPDKYDAAIILKATGELIGSVGLYYDPSDDAWSIGYNFRADTWGNGYATEAMKSLVNYAYGSGRVHSIKGTFCVDNIGSRRVMEHLGMTFVRDTEYTKLDGSETFKAREYRRDFAPAMAGQQAQAPQGMVHSRLVQPLIAPGAFFKKKQVFYFEEIPHVINQYGIYEKVGLKWYHFMVYFWVWFSAFIKFRSAVTGIVVNGGSLTSFLTLGEAAALVIAGVLTLKRKWAGVVTLLTVFSVMAFITCGIMALGLAAVGEQGFADTIMESIGSVPGAEILTMSDMVGMIKGVVIVEFCIILAGEIALLVANIVYFRNRRFYFCR